MKSEVNNDKWKKNIYPKYWSRASRAYGLDSYCAGLIKLVESYSPRTVFELAIGNGFPFAEAFCARGVKVFGCDISEDLISELSKDYPVVTAYVGGYNETLSGGVYDCVYCFRSSWYFSDIVNAIDFMLNKTASSGVLIFDIMNKDSLENKRMILKKNMLFPITILKNSLKGILNLKYPGRWMTDQIFGVRDIMYSPKMIEDYLRENGLQYSCLNAMEIATLGGGEIDVSSDQKLVFVVSKNG